MTSYVTLPENYRLVWSATCITVQRQVERKKRDGTAYLDWADISYYGPTYRGLKQATERVIGHYASIHGETDCERLSKALTAFAEDVGRAMNQAKLAA